MHIGIYQDLRNPPGWRRSWAEHYEGSLARVQEAESLGIDSVFFSEHHFFEDGYLPQPMVYAAAAAARTTRMRIGTSISLAPLRPPIEYAEQAAIVDLISGGRFELGLGVGYRAPEFAAYGADIRRRFEVFETHLTEIYRLLRDKAISPLPLRDPLPIWAGVAGPRGARIAGKTGSGLMWLDPGLLAPYREGLSEGGHQLSAARMSGVVNLVLSSDPERAWPRVKPFYAYQLDSYSRYGAEDRDDVGVLALKTLGQATDIEALRSPGPVMIIPNFDVVTADDAIARLRAWCADLPVVHAFFWDSVAGMDDDLVADHLELLATKVKPAVADLGIRGAAFTESGKAD